MELRNRWDFRSVEGALYGLGRPVDAPPAQSRPASTPSRSHAGPRAPIREVSARVDLSYILRNTLTDDEVQDIKDHYILGVRRLGGREGYARRERIIKKLVTSLNENNT